MPLIYRTGTASSWAQYHDIIKNHLQEAGWTVYDRSPHGGYYALVATNDGVHHYQHLSGAPIRLLAQTGYQPTNGLDQQTGKAYHYRSFVTDVSMPIVRYHFFGSEKYVWIVLERTTAKFRHYGFGSLDKCGSWEGGGFMVPFNWQYGTSNYSGFGWADATKGVAYFGRVAGYDTSEPYSGAWLRIVNANTATPAREWKGVVSNEDSWGYNDVFACPNVREHSFYVDRSPNNISEVTPLFPVSVYAAMGGGGVSLAGTYPGARILNMRNYEPGDIMTLGDDQWMILPVIQKKYTQASEYGDDFSGDWAIAYRKP